MELEDRMKICLTISVPKTAYIEVRKNLFARGISIQDLTSQIFRLIEINDSSVQELLKYVKESRIAGTKYGNIRVNARNLYDLIEEGNPLKP